MVWGRPPHVPGIRKHFAPDGYLVGTGVSRVAFLAKLADFGVDTFRHTETELGDDLAHA